MLRFMHFRDPVDTPEMVALFDAIITKNVITPLVDLNNKISKGKPATNAQPYIPTVKFLHLGFLLDGCLII